MYFILVPMFQAFLNDFPEC